MAHAINFENLVSEATGPNSDLEHAIRGLLMFAEETATDEDKAQFVSWLEGKTMLAAMYTANSSPSDWFECAEGKTWDEMEAIYLDR